MARFRLIVLCCGLAVAGAWGASPLQAEIIEDFTIVAGGNYSASSQVWGAALARGDVSGSATIGTMLTPAGDFADAVTLGVGGVVSGGPFNMSAGSVHLSGTTNGVTFNLNGGPGTQVIQNSSTVLPLANAAVNELTAASNFYSGIAANSSVDVNGNNITFNPVYDANNIATFSIQSSLLTMQNAAYMLNLAGAPAGATYLVNVVGNIASGVIPGGGSNFPAGFADVSDQILWNFADQTTDLTIQSEWQGSILLPNTNLTNSSPIDGGVYVGGNFNQLADVRSTGFTGFLPAAAVPEPSSLVLLSLFGLGCAGSFWRRRNAMG